MSIKVTCTIKVAEEEYEMESRDMEIFTEHGWAACTGVFAGTPAEIIESMIEGSVTRAQEQALKKLEVIKGVQSE